jgi:hypothetical protein
LDGITRSAKDDKKTDKPKDDNEAILGTWKAGEVEKQGQSK